MLARVDWFEGRLRIRLPARRRGSRSPRPSLFFLLAVAAAAAAVSCSSSPSASGAKAAVRDFFAAAASGNSARLRELMPALEKKAAEGGGGAETLLGEVKDYEILDVRADGKRQLVRVAFTVEGERRELSFPVYLEDGRCVIGDDLETVTHLDYVPLK